MEFSEHAHGNKKFLEQPTTFSILATQGHLKVVIPVLVLLHELLLQGGCWFSDLSFPFTRKLAQSFIIAY
jgi:hypothetical protein